jgi:hypothetical protein
MKREPKKHAAKESASDIVKTTLRVPRTLWTKVKYLAIDQRLTVQEINERALEMYLKAGAK